MKRQPLFIGIHGFAGSGKDTVTKMIRTILSRDWESCEECKNHYKTIYTDPTISATYNIDDDKRANNVFCIAFADQLKLICSNMFGIDAGRFYMNKESAWIAINKDFKYTEILPDEQHIITADEFYNNYSRYVDSSERYYMSLREILIYLGTYVLQQNINRNIFVNIVNNISNNEIKHNHDITHIICTDVRFNHEFEYIRNKHGILIDVKRNGISQLDNIAEHDLDYEDGYDFSIDNSGTYDDLFEQVWNMIHDNLIFSNITYELYTEDNANNYLRKIDDNRLMICNEYPLQGIRYNENDVYMINMVGGPTIKKNSPVETTTDELYVSDIIINEHVIIEIES